MHGQICIVRIKKTKVCSSLFKDINPSHGQASNVESSWIQGQDVKELICCLAISRILFPARCYDLLQLTDAAVFRLARTLIPVSDRANNEFLPVTLGEGECAHVSNSGLIQQEASILALCVPQLAANEVLP